MKAIARRQDDSRTPTTVVGNYFRDEDVKDGLAPILGKFTPRQIKNASGAGIDAAKKWIEKERTANTAHVINMARGLPVVSQWLAEQVGWTASTIDADGIIRWARDWRSAKGMEGDIARAVLRSLTAPEPEEVAPVRHDSEAKAKAARENFRIIGSEPTTYVPDGAAGDLLDRRRA
jgi:hypothetical protein